MFIVALSFMVLGGLLMAPLPQIQREALAHMTDAGLNAARCSMGWTWDELAGELLLNPSQLKRMRNGLEAFDFNRILLLPTTPFVAFQKRIAELKDATDESAAEYIAYLLRSFMASRGSRMARATVPEFEARKGQCA